MRHLFNFKTALCTTLLALSTSASFASVWQTEKNWSLEEEDKYTTWVENNWHQNIFDDHSSPYYGFITDCADAGYTMRMIYAYENKLPFEIYSRRLKRVLKNTISKYDRNPDGHLDSLLYNLDPSVIRRAKSNWQSFDHEKKVLFLFQRLINTVTSTWSLPQDTVAVKLGKGNIKAGQIILQRRYHTYTITGVDSYGNINLINSTTPPKVRNMAKATGYKAQPRYLYEEGALAFRWPNEAKKASHRIRRNSSQQYREWNKIMKKILEDRGQYNGASSIPKKNSDYLAMAHEEFKELIKYGNASFSGLSEQEEGFNRKINRKISELCEYTRERVNVVNDSLILQADLGGSCMNAAQYDNHSTPSRDSKIMKMYDDIINDYNNATSADMRTFDYTTNKRKLLALVEAKRYSLGSGGTTNFNRYNICSINYGESRYDSIQLDVFMSKLLEGNIMYDPNSSRDERWGAAEYRPVRNCTQY